MTNKLGPCCLTTYQRTNIPTNLPTNRPTGPSTELQPTFDTLRPRCNSLHPGFLLRRTTRNPSHSLLQAACMHCRAVRCRHGDVWTGDNQSAFHIRITNAACFHNPTLCIAEKKLRMQESEPFAVLQQLSAGACIKCMQAFSEVQAMGISPAYIEDS
jgi:hypothetical protein